MLDKSKPYGIIFGDSDGAKYEQDGVLFDAQGNRVGGEFVEPPKPVVKTAPKRTAKRTVNISDGKPTSFSVEPEKPSGMPTRVYDGPLEEFE